MIQPHGVTDDLCRKPVPELSIFIPARQDRPPSPHVSPPPAAANPEHPPSSLSPPCVGILLPASATGWPQIRQARPFFAIASPCEAAPVRQVGVREVPWGRLAASAEAPLIYVNIARPQHGNVAPPEPAWQLRQWLPFVSIDRPPCRNAAGVQFFVFAGVARRLAWKLLTWFHWPASTDQTLPRLILLSDAVGQVDAGPPREALRQKEFATGGPQGLPGQR